MPEMPHAAPAMMKVTITMRSTFRPDSRAASRLPPTP